MKVFRKKKREIIIDGHAFSWIVNETATHVKVRCYSLKSTYIEVIFNWGIATWAINFYQPLEGYHRSAESKHPKVIE